MNDKELADKIVELDVGYIVEMIEPHSGTAYVLYSDEIAFLTPKSFTRDWRVTGALMEKAVVDSEITIYGLARGDGIGCTVATSKWSYNISQNDSLPRAVNEACVEALS